MARDIGLIVRLYSFCMIIVIIILFAFSYCSAEDPVSKLERPKVVDGILFNPDGSMMWLDTYINSFRPGIQFWLDEQSAMKHVKRIQLEANFLLVGAGKNLEEVKNRVKNNETTEDFFRKAFCTEIENDKGYKKICVGNPDDYIMIVVRMIPDSPMRNCKFLFSFIEKKVAYELGCRDKDIAEYVDNRTR